MVIILSTGQFSKTQIASLVTSVLSLSWGAARSFLIMRPAGKADPDPLFMTVLLRIWPLTFLVTVDYLCILVCTAGLIGRYTFVTLCLGFIFTYSVLNVVRKIWRKMERKKRGEKKVVKNVKTSPEESQLLQTSHAPLPPSAFNLPPPSPPVFPAIKEVMPPLWVKQHPVYPLLAPASFLRPPQHNDNPIQADLDTEEENGGQSSDKVKKRVEDEEFLFMAAVCSTWIPSVVGDEEQRIFLISGLQCKIFVETIVFQCLM